MKSAPNRLACIDYLRGVAIILVFIFHSLGAAYGFDELPWNGLRRSFEVDKSFLALLPAAFGNLGVAVFFVISGFCIHLSHSKSKHPTFKEFGIRRFFRIYPPYLVCLVGFIFVYPKVHHMISHDGLIQISTHLALVHNFGKATFLGINGSLWSVAVEAQLYCLYLLLWLLAKRIGWGKVLGISAVCELVLRMWAVAAVLHPEVTSRQPLLIGIPFFYWFTWTIGAILAEKYLTGRLPAVSKSILAPLSAAVAVFYFYRPLTIFSFPLAAVLSAVYICINIRESTPVEGTIKGLVSKVGLVSYSLYLFHQPFIWLVARAFHAVTAGKRYPVACFLTCLAASVPAYYIARLMYIWLEVPSIALGNRFLRRFAQPTPPALNQQAVSSVA